MNNRAATCLALVLCGCPPTKEDPPPRDAGNSSDAGQDAGSDDVGFGDGSLGDADDPCAAIAVCGDYASAAACTADECNLSCEWAQSSCQTRTTPSDCTIGAVTSACLCGGVTVSSGFCCSYGPSAEACLSGPIYYIASSATGSGSGADWHDAFPTMPDPLERGAIYFVASGSYGAYTFDDSGSDLIILRKATAAEHGTEVGWQASFGSARARFGPLSFDADYYEMDGGEGNGFLIVGAFEGLVVDFGSDHVTMRRCELDGNFTLTSGQHTDGVCNGANIHGSHVTIEHCDIHNIADDGVGVYGSQIALRHNKIHALHGCGTDGSCGPCYNGHSDGLELQNTTDVELMGNMLYDIKSTAALITGQWTAGNYTRNLTMINNIFYTPDTGITVYLSYIQRARIHNNVIWGRTQGSRYGGLAIGPEVTDMEMSNNIILNINFDHLGGTFDPANHRLENNLFAMVAASEYTAGATEIVADPGFVGIPVSSELSQHKTDDLVAEDFLITAVSPAVDSGKDLPAVAVDRRGTARPQDGNNSGSAEWDIGVFELSP